MSLDLKWHCFVSHTSVSKNKEAAKSLCHNKATEVALVGDGKAIVGQLNKALDNRQWFHPKDVPYERREPLREYIVRENRPSYRYEDEVAVGRELPRGAYESYEVPEEYGIREHHYAIINGRPVIFHPQTRRIVHIYD